MLYFNPKQKRRPRKDALVFKKAESFRVRIADSGTSAA